MHATCPGHPKTCNIFYSRLCCNPSESCNVDLCHYSLYVYCNPSESRSISHLFLCCYPPETHKVSYYWLYCHSLESYSAPNFSLRCNPPEIYSISYSAFSGELKMYIIFPFISLPLIKYTIYFILPCVVIPQKLLNIVKSKTVEVRRVWTQWVHSLLSSRLGYFYAPFVST
jgi:hypothetical protein